MTDDEKIDTPKVVAETVGLHPHTLLRMRKLPDAGGLPFVRLSTKRIGYRRGDVREFIAARTNGTLPQRAA